MRKAGIGGTAGLVLALAGCIPDVAPPPRPTTPAGQEPSPPPEDDRPGRGAFDVPAPRPARPSWETRPVAADAQEVAETAVIVRRGEGLRAVADRSGAGVEAIARANGLVPPYVIRIGQRLTVPGGRYHLVRPGQSGIAIARAYGVPWPRIVTANALAEPYLLSAGQRILIPGDQPAGPSRAAERAAAFRLDVDSILTGGEPALAENQTPTRPVSRPTRPLPPNAAVAPPVRLAGGGFVWPVEGRVVKRFGPGASGERNDGIKIAVPVGTPVGSVADGVVAYAGDGIAALGGLVIVKHGGGWTSVYGHASRLLVSRGQSVKRGQAVALSGDTGFADRPEVHFELRKGRTPVDPQTQLPRR
jgi:murein DD-endopeptidase MepM/ murein hydrolase activator NlpD